MYASRYSRQAVIGKPTVRIMKIIDSQRKNFITCLFIHVCYSFTEYAKHYELLFLIRDFDIKFSIFLAFGFSMKRQTRFH